LAVALALAFFVSPLASNAPDGLNKVAEDTGLASTERGHPLADTSLDGYSVDGVEDEGLAKGLAGVLGVAATFALTGLTFALLRRKRGAPG
jgi:cobalt/nickel transport system permease protein/cobalt/nickel transport protein